jgi:hypothetical protein
LTVFEAEAAGQYTILRYVGGWESGGTARTGRWRTYRLRFSHPAGVCRDGHAALRAYPKQKALLPGMQDNSAFLGATARLPAPSPRVYRKPSN